MSFANVNTRPARQGDDVMARLTPHQRIMRAFRRGTGLRLSADEVHRLAMDDAIATCAANDDEDAGLPPQGRFQPATPDPEAGERVRDAWYGRETES